MVRPSVPQVPQWIQTATDFKGPLRSAPQAMAAAQYSSRPYPENFTADPKLAAVCETVHAKLSSSVRRNEEAQLRKAWAAWAPIAKKMPLKRPRPEDEDDAMGQQGSSGASGSNDRA